MKRILFIFASILLINGSAFSQSIAGASDPHFSQFYAQPLLLNPALTGAFDCNVRIGAIYRGQWGAVLRDEQVPMFSSPSVFVDFRTNKGFMQGDAFGIGLTFLNDMAGQSKFTTNRGGLSIAYHKSLDRRNEHFISVGFKSEIWQRSIDYRGLQWGAQHDGFGGYDAQLPTGEYLVNNNFLFWDISVGGLYTGRVAEKSSVYVGFAADHLNRPKESFLGDKTVRLPMRFVAHGGFRFPIKGRWDGMPKFIYMNQGVSHELNLGAEARIVFDEREHDGNNFKIGAMFRMVGGDNKAAWHDKVLNPEAVVLNIAVEFQKINVGAAYDINVSELTKGTRTRGAFELYANWVGCFPRSRPQTLFCPKF